jgi:hypothetical protein
MLMNGVSHVQSNDGTDVTAQNRAFMRGAKPTTRFASTTRPQKNRAFMRGSPKKTPQIRNEPKSQ